MVASELLRHLDRNLDVSDVAQLAFRDAAFTSLSLASATVKTYVAEAARQQARIQRGHRTIRAAFQRLRSTDPFLRRQQRRGTDLPFTAIHFYANCWTIVGRQLTAIRDISQIPAVGRALRPHVHSFERFTALRDHFEHLDERLPGRKHADKVGQIYGMLASDKFVFGRTTIDVGPSSLETLRKTTRDVLTAFKAGSIETIAERDPERFAALVHRARGKHISRSVNRLIGRHARQSG